MVAELRAARALIVPEIETLGQLSGTRTVQTVVRAGPLEPYATAAMTCSVSAAGDTSSTS